MGAGKGQTADRLKNKYGLTRKDSIQSICTNPNGEKIIVYIWGENTLKRTIAKINKQIEKHSKIDEKNKKKEYRKGDSKW